MRLHSTEAEVTGLADLLSNRPLCLHCSWWSSFLAATYDASLSETYRDNGLLLTSVVLNVWVSVLLGERSCISDIYSILHSANKISC